MRQSTSVWLLFVFIEKDGHFEVDPFGLESFCSMTFINYKKLALLLGFARNLDSDFIKNFFVKISQA